MQAKSYCYAYSVLYKMCRILIILSGALIDRHVLSYKWDDNKV